MSVGKQKYVMWIRVLLYCTVFSCLILIQASKAKAQTTTTFDAGSLIIPMDIDYQNEGMLKAFGLLYQLLLNRVPVHWVIQYGKNMGDADFFADAQDLQTSTPIIDHEYRGGPFVIDSEYAAQALPIVASWQLSHTTAVHVATSEFSGTISKTMVVAPNIGIFADGNESIAFGYLNAAGIPDSLDNTWTAASPDALDLVEVRGPSLAVPNDGSLFDQEGDPVYCQLMSMHWGVKDAEKPEGQAVVAEVRSFLGFRTHFFAECQAVNAYENNVNGHFLTENGFIISADPAPVIFRNSWYPFAQLDGPFATVGGSERSYSLPAGQYYKDLDIVMITKNGTTPLSGNSDLWMTGYLDGICSIEEPGLCADGVGKVSYLGGHEYNTDVPISAHSDTQGTRLFLNSLFEADCVIEEAQPWISLSASAPRVVTGATATYSFDFGNFGHTTALNASLAAPLPTGTTFVSATDGGVESGGVVTWDLGNLGVMERGTVSLTVALSALGEYETSATLSYRSGNTQLSVVSNTIRVAYEQDDDGDGCSNNQELSMGTALDLPDSDGDGTWDCDDNCPLIDNPLQDLLTDPDNCGACGVACNLPNAVATCVGGTCRVDSCSGGYEDCDGEPSNGCEEDSPPCDTPPITENETVKPNILIIFDTSGSMLDNQCDGQQAPVGDGEVGKESRIYNLKEAIHQSLFYVGTDEANFGLMRFAQFENACSLDACGFDGTTAGYYRIHPFHTGGANANPGCVMSTHDDETSYGVWFDDGVAEALLIPVTRSDKSLKPSGPWDFDPSDANIPEQLRWLNHQTVCSDGAISDPEVQSIRWQYTGLGRSLFYARMYFDNYVVSQDNTDLYPCRQNIVILITDGEDTCDNNLADLPAEPTSLADCEGGDPFNPTRQACLLFVPNQPSHPYSIKTYVVTQTGLGGSNDAIARAGGTGQAIEADFTDQDQVKAALLSIIARSVPAAEVCNGLDDNCNGLVDEGVSNNCAFDAIGLSHCATEQCNGADDDCDGEIDDGYPANSCGGPCGVSVPEEIACNGVDDDCNPSTPDIPDPCTCAVELCDGVDNYCDDHATQTEGAEDPRVGKSCSTDTGACTEGTTYCWQDPGDPSLVEIRCSGTTPIAEACDTDDEENDQNCNGVNNDGIAPTPCSNTNSWGTCDGQQVCDTNGEWICYARVPTDEVCNEIDDDCDGQTDEALTRPCRRQNEFGICLGSETCLAGGWIGCDAATPAEEICNDQDDDCDGRINENVFRSCQVQNTYGTCVGVESCTADGEWAGCNAATPAAETCNNSDDDCDGLIDNGVTRSCYIGPEGTLGVGICASGTQTCSLGLWGACQGSTVPATEICDGQDNNCDGDTDEDFGQTTCGQGNCLHTVDNCQSGVPQICNPFAGAEPEACDTQDNDCDGVTDGLTRACYDYDWGCTENEPGVWECEGTCVTGTQSCPVDGSGFWEACQYDVGPSDEVCDGLDNDCDGETDEADDGGPLTTPCYAPGSGENSGCQIEGDDWVCQGACQIGNRSCLGGVWQSCEDEVTPTLELCNKVDDDCDGETDEAEEIVGLNEPCGTTLGRCEKGIFHCEDGEPICDGAKGPFPGECNWEDDDCDGEVDESDEVSEFEGQPCGDDEGLCEPGFTKCIRGEISCVEGVQPAVESCDCEDNDCDGETDEFDDSGTLCPPGSECVDCQCALPCSDAGEFGISCPSGKAAYTLDGGECYCVGERCQREDCAEQTVVIDGETRCAPTGDFASPCVCKNNLCTYACDGVICANNTICDTRDGRCKEDSCINFGCPEGEVCNRNSGACLLDPCLNTTCAQNEVCYQGTCFISCDEGTPCPTDQHCVESRCEQCEQGECVETQEKPNANDSEEDLEAGYKRLLATGGGGCACEIAGGRNTPTSRGALWILTICLLGLLFVRRRVFRSYRCSAEMRRLALIIALFGVLILSIGCSVDPFCLDCPSRNPLTKDSGTSSHAEGGAQTGNDSSTVDTDSAKTDLHQDGGTDSACLDTERCNGEDDDCDGLTDEDFDLDSDPNNCGSCGLSCSYEHAFAQCVDGSCRFSGCDVGFHDLDNNEDNGCEYACLKSAEDDSVCDQSDNDCNGVIDDAFDLQNDPEHCGRCNNQCAFFKAVGSCHEGRCGIERCRGGYADTDEDSSNGCECRLVLDEGSDDACDEGDADSCDESEACVDIDDDGVWHCSVVPPDICDGVDSDCDGDTDEDAADQLEVAGCYTYGAGCSETSPGVFACIGECRAGEFRCIDGNFVCDGQVPPGAEICDNLDNDCDGTDDNGFFPLVDPANCGGCGNQCSVLIPNAVSGCEGGECKLLACLPGFWDRKNGAADGCEYPCTLSNGGVELCGDNQDNDCDTETDEGFDLSDDVNNCGYCGHACSANKPFGTEMVDCYLGNCRYECIDGFHDIDQDLDEGEQGDGCEYYCIETFDGEEQCDGVDNDCDNEIDEDFFISSNADNCGACGYVCAEHLGSNTTVVSCVNGGCVYACEENWYDLNNDRTLGDTGTGCEYECLGGAVDEVCDGDDNDCDGQTDEGADGGLLTQPCYTGSGGTEGVGTCRAGVKKCIGGFWGSCEGDVTPQSEICDGYDNDCNGEADDTFDFYTDINNCSACNNSCWNDPPDNSYPVGCEDRECVYTCTLGYGDANRNLNQAITDGCEYPCPVNPPSEEYCDGLDNDCDGETDEELTAPEGVCYQGIDGAGPFIPGSAENNPCKGVIATCLDPDADGELPHGWYCQYPDSVETVEGNPNAISGIEWVCDGKDGDCDGVADDEYHAGQTCYAGQGTCRRAGTLVCSDGQQSTQCDAVSGSPGVEICDGEDNDCDGTVDEADPSDPNFIQYGAFVYIPSADVTIFAYEASRSNAGEQTAGFGDDGVPCSVPGVIPWYGVTAVDESPFGDATVSEICQRLGAGWNLCTVEEWYAACADGSYPDGGDSFPYGSLYDPLACNGYDYGVANVKVGVRKTGDIESCQRAFSGGTAYDLSGNLKEWVLNGTDFELRGGAYNNVSHAGEAPALRCDGASPSESGAEIHLSSIGFRCCYEGNLF